MPAAGLTHFNPLIGIRDRIGLRNFSPSGRKRFKFSANTCEDHNLQRLSKSRYRGRAICHGSKPCGVLDLTVGFPIPIWPRLFDDPSPLQ